MTTPEQVAREFCRRASVRFLDAPAMLTRIVRRERLRAFDAGVEAAQAHRHPEFGNLTPDTGVARRRAMDGEGGSDG